MKERTEKKDYFEAKAENKKMLKQAMILLVVIVVVFFAIIFRFALN